MEWIIKLFTEQTVAHAVVIYGLVIAIGIWLGRVKIFGISLGVTWVLFIGLLSSYLGVSVNKETEDFLRDFGLILFVYSVGLQVGPGFFASLRKNALANNLLAGSVVLLGVVITITLKYVSGSHITLMAGVMSGAVTNTPGLAAAQAAVKEMSITNIDNSLITLAYACAYPFGVFGIILSLIILKRIFKVNLETERELHRKLNVFRSKRPVSVHLNLDNPRLIGQPLRKVFSLLKDPIVVSRMLKNGEVITPTPDVILEKDDVLLVVVPKHELDTVKLLIGTESPIDLKTQLGSKLIVKHIVVTNKEVTHQRLGDIHEIHQDGFTLTRLSRAGIELVPHGNIYLQLGDTLKVVGTEEGVEGVVKLFGNSLKRLEVPDLAPIFMGIVLGVIVGSIPIYFPNMPVSVKIGMAGGPLIVALLLSRFGGILYLNTYTTNSANLMVREMGITLFLASVGLHSGGNLAAAFVNGSGWTWILMGAVITVIPLLTVGIIAHKFFRKTYFEICGLLSGASTDPPALAFALKIAGNDIPSATYATVYPLTMIMRIVAAELLILLFA
ncbi:putative transporter [Ferruginibacter lapsinanis]|uniref:putative transporter n=1 Tax=Ferruginibacter lapsinanis TaxID=563172 RepID=UPI001E527ED9|nr:putative transporter [Ferruginibacter lapsinanis]UEG48700.1 putative transporter [Ferruginibacter lapsinanis]